MSQGLWFIWGRVAIGTSFYFFSFSQGKILLIVWCHVESCGVPNPPVWWNLNSNISDRSLPHLNEFQILCLFLCLFSPVSTQADVSVHVNLSSKLSPFTGLKQNRILATSCAFSKFITDWGRGIFIGWNYSYTVDRTYSFVLLNTSARVHHTHTHTYTHCGASSIFFPFPIF